MTQSVIWDEQAGAFRVRGFEEASSVLRGSGWSSDPANSLCCPPTWPRFPRP